MFKEAVDKFQPPVPLSDFQKPVALGSTPSSLLNSLPQFTKNPLKRKAGPISPRADMNALPRSRSRLGDLHAAIAFDENDFDDDSKINLDSDEPDPAPQLQPPTVHPLHPKLPQSQNSINSTPLPWSSSPPEALRRLSKNPLPAAQSEDPGKALRRRSLPGEADSSIEEARKSDDTQPDETTQKATKRRVLPWKSRDLVFTEDLQSIYTRDNGLGSRKMKKKDRSDDFSKRDIKSKSIAQAPAPVSDVFAQVFFSAEQKAVLDLVCEKGKSVFFTGSAGTGKSVLMKEIIKRFRQKHRAQADRVAITASTGLAACNIGGVTLHSFAGIGLGKESVPELVRKIKRNAKAKQRWMRTKILIIDEISMVDGDLFDKLEAIARIVRSNGRPFGGLQLIITGDFFQLPPVPEYGRSARFAFDAGAWNTSIEHTIGLTQIFRQKDQSKQTIGFVVVQELTDAAFADMLNEMRLGKLTPKSILAFRSLARPLAFEDDFTATELFPTRVEVESANNMRMANLSGKEMEFSAVDGGTIQEPLQRDKLLQNCMAPKSITLKKGAQVMLIKNIDENLVNGSVGKVVAFMNESTFDHYDKDEEAYQQREIESEDQSVKDRLLQHSAVGSSKVWPLVRFKTPNGSFRELLCQHETWKIELPNGEVQASRMQVPLMLAWALSIHKAQGQTLDRVKVDLGRAFEKGQAYVALSRATSQQGLQVLRFDPSKVQAHERVRKLYDSLYTAQQATARRTLDQPDVDEIEGLDETRAQYVLAAG